LMSAGGSGKSVRFAIKSMNALVLSEYRRLGVEELAAPVCGPGDVLIQVAACGICGSDVHGYDGSSGRRIPPGLRRQGRWWGWARR
jgi:NADPH:quinone reductase-like Zn-dependent oxidoreductase